MNTIKATSTSFQIKLALFAQVDERTQVSDAQVQSFVERASTFLGESIEGFVTQEANPKNVLALAMKLDASEFEQTEADQTLIAYIEEVVNEKYSTDFNEVSFEEFEAMIKLDEKGFSEAAIDAVRFGRFGQFDQS